MKRALVAAGELDANERLTTYSNEIQTVVRNRSRGNAEVYNFEVDHEHVYFIGVDGTLVHNAYPVQTGRGIRWYDDVAKKFVSEQSLKGPRNIALGLDMIPAKIIRHRYPPGSPEYLNGVPLLKPFAKTVDAIPNGRWQQAGLGTNKADFGVRFNTALDIATNEGGRIKFNLDYVDLTRAFDVDVRKVISPVGDVPSVTVWELQQILHNRKWYDATDFFVGNTKLDVRDVLEFGLRYGAR